MWNENAWEVVVNQNDAIEFDWYGVDRVGNMAAFSTYGRGVIPLCCKRSRVDYNNLYDRVAALPNVGECELVFDGKGKYDDWLKYARQGFFAYDYQDAHRTAPLGQYDLIARPKKPIRFERLQLEPELLAIIPLVDIEFGRELVLPFNRFPA